MLWGKLQIVADSVFCFQCSAYSLPFTVCRCAALSFSVFHFPCTIFCFQFKVFSKSFYAPLAVCGHLFGPVIVIYMYCASCRHVSPHCGWVRALFQPVWAADTINWHELFALTHAPASCSAMSSQYVFVFVYVYVYVISTARTLCAKPKT